MLYHFVWIVFLVDISLHILLEYKDTRQTFSMLTWILTFLLYLTLVPVVFHRPEVEGAVQAVWDFLNGKAYHLVLLLVLSFLNLSYGWYGCWDDGQTLRLSWRSVSSLSYS